MPRFDEGEQNLKLIYGNIVLMGNPDQYGEILAENIFVEDITRSALQTLISNSELVRGKYYRITNAVGSTLSFIVTALTANTIAETVFNSANGEAYKYDITADIAILEPNPIALGSANQILGVNNAGTAQEYKTLTSTDSSVAITHSAGGIDLSVDSISGLSAGGELAGTYPNPTLVNNSVTAKVLTGLSVAGSAIVSTDSILTAIGKAQNQINALAGGVNYRGTWNASTNSPSLASGVGTKGYYYVVTVAGSTNLDGITDWKLGDWAIFNGTSWQKVDNTDAVVSVNGYMGIVTLSASDVGALPTSAISGTTGYIPKFTASGAVGDSVIRESSSKIAINSANYTGALTIKNFIADGSTPLISVRSFNDTFEVATLSFSETTDILTLMNKQSFAGSGIAFGTNSIVRLQIYEDGQIITANATDTGEHFIVGGSARVNGALVLNGGVIDNRLSGSTYYQVGLDGSANYVIYNSNLARTDFTITQATGAATFSSSVSAGSFSTAGLLNTSDRLWITGDVAISSWLSNSLTAGYSATNSYGWVNSQTSLRLGVNGTSQLNLTTTTATFNSSVTAGTYIASAMPTSPVGLPSGALWNDSGTVKIV